MKDVDKTYENVISGGLKLKGKVISKSKGTKKVLKSASSSSSFSESNEDQNSFEFLTLSTDSEHQKDHNAESDEASTFNQRLSKSEILKQRIERVKNDPSLTSSEKTFKIAQIKRTYQRIENSLKETHKQKIEKFNTKLSKLSEHFDIPKVGPG